MHLTFHEHMLFYSQKIHDYSLLGENREVHNHNMEFLEMFQWIDTGTENESPENPIDTDTSSTENESSENSKKSSIDSQDPIHDITLPPTSTNELSSHFSPHDSLEVSPEHILVDSNVHDTTNLDSELSLINFHPDHIVVNHRLNMSLIPKPK